jgi:EAL domain-containing protein (putative c-di-GMP-specific phosphodiesterase class I)/PleD family two-component response regulator
MNIQKIKQLSEDSKYLRLLYVEDNEYARESTLEILSMFFHNIQVCENGEEGLEEFLKAQFDIIITDINMPKMNGLDMITEIRKHNSSIPILILSAYNDTEYYADTIKIGVDGYLLKPVDMTQFIDLIEKTVNNINKELELNDYRVNLENRVEEQSLKLKESLYKDNTTGLYNFLKLQEDMQDSLFKTLIIFDITQLSIISKQYGHIFIGKLLNRVATILSTNINSDMMLYKLEADKFAILTKDESYENISTFCDQVLAFFDMSTIVIDDIEVSITFNIGIATIDKVSDSTINAEYALSSAKKVGYRYYFFDDIDTEIISKEKEMISWLGVTKELIENDMIVPYYQVIQDLKNAKIVKYEVLARGELDGKTIMPAHFLDAAERLGLTSTITRMIIQKSFQFFATNSYDFSINISQRDLVEGFLPKFFQQKMSLYNIEASRITLEILENITVSVDNKAIQAELSRLKDMGFSIAVDDFGIENSNFGKLIDINLDILKIDGYFIKNILRSEKDMLVVKSITSLAKILGMKVVAEYVESKEILDSIKELGIDYAQGYYIGKPNKILQENR